VDFAKGFFVLVMLSAGVLMAMGSNPRGMAQAQTADHETTSHNSGATAGETKQAKAHKPTGEFIMWAGTPYAHVHVIGRP
jgi:hypothetical protein